MGFSECILRAVERMLLIGQAIIDVFPFMLQGRFSIQSPR